MRRKKETKIEKVLKRYNYWRRSMGLSFWPKRKPFIGTQCQVACHSDPCSADPTCSFD